MMPASASRRNRRERPRLRRSDGQQKSFRKHRRSRNSTASARWNGRYRGEESAVSPRKKLKNSRTTAMFQAARLRFQSWKVRMKSTTEKARCTMCPISRRIPTRFASPSPGRKLRIKSTRERTPSAPIKAFSSWIRGFCFIL